MAVNANSTDSPYKTIELTKGYVTKVDPEWYDMLAGIKWSYKKGYAITQYGKKRHLESMHRVILGAPNGMQVDHINGDRLDNRSGNLRLCTGLQNSKNRTSAWGKSQYKGVLERSYGGKSKWSAKICSNSKVYYLGVFTTEEEAAKAYNAAAKRLHGDFAFLNNV